LDRHQQIDFLLTDITMPGSMGGVRLGHHVRKRWPPMNIVVTSGRPETKLSGFTIGSKVFPKPYDHEALRHALTPFVAANRDQFSGPKTVAR
jgi:CheY-like chemotaxis protein